MDNVRKYLILLILILGLVVDGSAQCSMCKAVAETGAQSGSDIGGINDGIIYLMGIPYLLIMTVGYLIYRNNKKLKSGIE